MTVVDEDVQCVRRMDALDVRAIQGSASEASVLFQADVIGADVCLAVTGVDEVNLIAASLAKAMGSRRTMARVFSPVIRDTSTFDYQRHFQIDRLMSLEQLSAMEFVREIRHPGAFAIENLAHGQLELQELQLQSGAAAVNRKLRDLKLPKDARIGSISRDGTVWIAGAEDELWEGDRISIIGRGDAVDEVAKMLEKRQPPRKLIVIVGGGETGYHLARGLEGRQYAITVVERAPERCEFLAANLKHSTIVHADATRREVMEEERVGQADVFVACFGDDEDNIMTCVEARQIGAQKMMAIVGRPDYADVVGKLGIDVTVSPRNVLAHQVLGFLNQGAVMSRASVAHSSINILELEVGAGVPVTQATLAELPFPNRCLIVGVTREQFVIVPGANDRLQPGDLVVALVDETVFDETLSLFELPSKLRAGRSA